MIALALGAACLAGEPGRAAALFGSVPAEVRPREGWWGLVAARLTLGDAAGAAEALGWVLARFVMRGEWVGLAAAAVRAAGAAGWCGVGSGDLVVAGEADPRAVVGRLDGRRVALEGLTAGAGRLLDMRAGGVALLGSPLRLDAIRRVEGCVAAGDGGLRGWAWRPGDPDAEPVVTVRAGSGRTLRVVCAGPPPAGFAVGPLARAHGFSVSPFALVGAARRDVRVLGGAGTELLGSPLNLDLLVDGVADRCDRAGHARPGLPRRVPRARAPGVVVPVHGQADAVEACLRAVLATVPAGTLVVVVDDGSPEPGLRRTLRALAAAGRIQLISHRRPRGFPAAANAGVAACPGRDVVLLDSDTVPAPGWIERLRAVADAAPDIGSVTPLSNNAGIVSYPGPAGSTPMPDAAGGAWLAALAWRVAGARAVRIPVGLGFCLYVRRACWEQAGPFRAALFAQGSGEEIDFCLRARALGWRHVAAPGVFVGHRGGASFGAAVALQARNQMVIERLHPGYAAEMAAFREADPLAPARRRLDRARWEAARGSGSLAAAVPMGGVPEGRGPGGASPAPAVLLITHADGGGVERVVAASCQAHRAGGRRAIVLRPGAGAGRGREVVLEAPDGGDTPNLRFALPRELPALLRLLNAEPLVGIELHHLLGHPPAVAEIVAALGVPYEVHMHDYAWVCPRVTLTRPVGRAGAPGPDHYCGAPALPACEACIATHGSLLDEPIGVRALRRRSAALLHGARRVVVASADAAMRLRAVYARRWRPASCRSGTMPPCRRPPRRSRSPAGCASCVVGAIGPAKGIDVLLACAGDAARRESAARIRGGRPDHGGHCAAGDRARIRHRPVPSGGGDGADPRAAGAARAAALDLAGDLVFRADGCMGGAGSMWWRSTLVPRRSASAGPGAAWCCRRTCRRRGSTRCCLPAPRSRSIYDAGRATVGCASRGCARSLLTPASPDARTT